MKMSDINEFGRLLFEYLTYRSTCEVVDMGIMAPQGIIKVEIKNPMYKKPKTKMLAYLEPGNEHGEYGIAFFKKEQDKPYLIRTPWLDGEVE